MGKMKRLIEIYIYIRYIYIYKIYKIYRKIIEIYEKKKRKELFLIMKEKKKIIIRILDKWNVRKTKEALEWCYKEDIIKLIQEIVDKNDRVLARVLKEYSAETIIEILNTVQLIENVIDKEVQEFKEIAQKECTAEMYESYRLYKIIEVLRRMRDENRDNYLKGLILQFWGKKKNEGSFSGFEKERVREHLSQILVKEGTVSAVGEISDEMLVDRMKDVETITKKIEEEVEKNNGDEKVRNTLGGANLSVYKMMLQRNGITSNLLIAWTGFEGNNDKSEDVMELLMVLWDLSKKKEDMGEKIEAVFLKTEACGLIEMNEIVLSLYKVYKKNYKNNDAGDFVESIWRIWKEGKNKKE